MADASPLILLGKVGRLDLLRGLADEVVVPSGVAHEVEVRTEGQRLLREWLDPPTVRIETCGPIPRRIQAWDLGRGEAEVLTLSLASESSRAVLDDLEARRCAQAMGIPVIGTLGVVLRARPEKLIPAARPVLDEIRAAGLYVSPDLVESILEHLGE